jgi:uncharacterized protein (UPF0332 family)
MTESDPYVLTKYRMEQAHAALEEADILFSQGKTTLGSVNRSYYAMFYAVIALLQRIGRVPRKHSGALALFDEEFVKKGVFPKDLSQHLHHAFESRQVSDYQTVSPVSREDAEEILKRAKVFVQTLEDYLKLS